MTTRKSAAVSTREQVETLLEQAQKHLKRTLDDSESKASERSAALAAVKAILRDRARLRGELEITEATIVRSLAWKRLQSRIVDALRVHPEAEKSFLAAMQAAESESGS